MAVLFTGGGVQRCDAGPGREPVSVGEPCDIADVGEDPGSHDWSDPVDVHQGGAAGGDHGLELGVRASARREPGARLVMLNGRDGLTVFAASNGEPYNPGAGVAQPTVARAVERTDGVEGTCRINGGDGVRYRSGKAFRNALKLPMFGPDNMS